MARGGARPGAGRPARKSANTSPPSTRARARARETAGNERPWPADKVPSRARARDGAGNQRPWPADKVGRERIKEWGWTTPALVGEGRRADSGPRQDTRRPAAAAASSTPHFPSAVRARGPVIASSPVGVHSPPPCASGAVEPPMRFSRAPKILEMRVAARERPTWGAASAAPGRRPATARGRGRQAASGFPRA